VRQDRERPAFGGRPSGWLLLRRRSALWGVPPGALRELRGSRPPRLELKNGKVLVADELLSLTAELESRPFPRCARRFFRDKILGLALWREEPVILLEPGTPPECLGVDSANSETGDHGDETR
jgi:hypothetical protein